MSILKQFLEITRRQILINLTMYNRVSVCYTYMYIKHVYCYYAKSQFSFLQFTSVFTVYSFYTMNHEYETQTLIYSIKFIINDKNNAIQLHSKLHSKHLTFGKTSEHKLNQSSKCPPSMMSSQYEIHTFVLP